MRKFLILFVMLFSIGAFTETEAQILPCSCPPPSYTYTILENISDGTNSCDVYITYCRSWSKNNSTGGVVYPFSICDVKFTKPCNLNIDLSTTFWDIITERVIKKEIGSGFITLLPCSTGYYRTDAEITKAQCWILENDLIQQMFVFTPCTGETAKCITTYKICELDGELEVTKLTTNIEGTSNCTYEGGLFLDPETFPFDTCFDTCY